MADEGRCASDTLGHQIGEAVFAGSARTLLRLVPSVPISSTCRRIDGRRGDRGHHGGARRRGPTTAVLGTDRWTAAAGTAGAETFLAAADRARWVAAAGLTDWPRVRAWDAGPAFVADPVDAAASVVSA